MTALWAPERRVFWVLALSGIMGFRLGMVAFPTWHVAVETAQVVAGLVQYPDGNPFYIYHTKLWTVLHQICAVLLMGGVSEIALSKFLSGVVGMVSFQALAMTTFAIGRSALLALLAPFVVLVSRAADNGGTYPVMLIGSAHTYGALGLSTLVLAVASLGAGSAGLGGFLLGLMPAVHPSIGAWLWLTMAVALMLSPRTLLEDSWPGAKGFIAGAFVMALSLTIQLTVTYDVPSVDASVTRPYLSAFLAFWDGHRTPVHFGSPAVLLNQGALALGLIWLTAFRDRLTAPARLMLRFVIVCAVLSLVLAWVSWIPPDRVPANLLMLMPTRLLNVNVMMFTSLLIGLVGLYSRTPWAQVALATLLAGVVVSSRSEFWESAAAERWTVFRPALDQLSLLQMFGIAAVALGASAWSKARHDEASAAEQVDYAHAGWGTRVFSIIVVLVLIASSAKAWQIRSDVQFPDRTNDPLFAAAAAEDEGLLLMAGTFGLVQLYTRRPVLLDGALDMLPYAPEAGPEMARILLDVYGIDLFNPPPSARGGGVVPRALHRQLWEENTRARWLEIGRTYNVTQILVPLDWTLDLPVAAEDHEFRLYRIPAADPM